MATLEITLAADHAAARGHFPGNPVIPGAALLAETLRAVGAAMGRDFAQCRIASAKFPSPSRPGDRVDVDYTTTGARIVLVASVAERTVLRAEIACDPTANRG